MNKLIVWMIKLIASRLDGKKAYIGAGGQMLSGIGVVITGIVGAIGTLYPNTGLPAIELEVAWTTVAGGAYMVSSGFKSFGQRMATAKVEAQIAELPKEGK
jgi:hypothetical protein